MKKLNTRDLILAAVFAALTAVGAFIRIPLGFATITLQSFFVISAGILLAPKYALFSQCLYLFIGLIGIPIFAYGGGFAYVLHPTFGFLLSFPLSAFTISIFIRKSKIRNSFFKILLACTIGVLINYIIGMPYMYMAINLFTDGAISFEQALISGCALYLPFDIVKIIAATIIGTQVLKRLKPIQQAN